MASLGSRKDVAQPHEFDESTNGPEVFVERSSNQLAAVEKNAAEYTAKTGETISEQSKKNIFLSKIVPTDMRQHLMLNQTRLESSEAIADEIEEYCKAMEEFNK